MIVGVGGQGTLLASKLLGTLLLERGLRRQGQRGTRHEPARRQRRHLCPLRRQGLFPHHRQGRSGLHRLALSCWRPPAGRNTSKTGGKIVDKHPADQPHAGHHRRGGTIPRSAGDRSSRRSPSGSTPWTRWVWPCGGRLGQGGQSRPAGTAQPVLPTLQTSSGRTRLRRACRPRFLELNKKAFAAWQSARQAERSHHMEHYYQKEIECASPRANQKLAG